MWEWRCFMALKKQHAPHMERLILEAAAEIRRLNPLLYAPQQFPTEAEYAEIEHGREDLERVWDEMERAAGGPLPGEPAAHAVEEDRGE
jgi:hypothetical protein